MAHTRGVLTQARFCPWCGLASLQRDYYRNRTGRVEYVCGSCGVGMRLGESTRRQDANRMFAEHRRLRVPNVTKPGDQFRRESRAQWKEFKRVGQELTANLMREWVAQHKEVAHDGNTARAGLT